MIYAKWVSAIKYGPSDNSDVLFLVRAEVVDLLFLCNFLCFSMCSRH